MKKENKNNESDVMRFENFLMEEIKKHVQEKDEKEAKTKKDKGLASKTDLYDVADIQMGFDNSKMMQFLEKRANHLKKLEFTKANDVEVQMTAYKNKGENYKKLTTPTMFYCTFRHEYAYHLALKADKPPAKIDLLGNEV